MYIAFFLLLAFLGYGGLFWRKNPLLLILSIISVLILILLPMSGDVEINSNFGGTTVGNVGGDATTAVNSGSDTIVLLSLTDGWEYTVWIWLHVAILLIHFTVFIREMLQGVL